MLSVPHQMCLHHFRTRAGGLGAVQGSPRSAMTFQMVALCTACRNANSPVLAFSSILALTAPPHHQGRCSKEGGVSWLVHKSKLAMLTLVSPSKPLSRLNSMLLLGGTNLLLSGSHLACPRKTYTKYFLMELTSYSQEHNLL